MGLLVSGVLCGMQESWMEQGDVVLYRDHIAAHTGGRRAFGTESGGPKDDWRLAV